MVSNTNIAYVLFGKCFMHLYIVCLMSICLYRKNSSFRKKEKEKIVLKIYLGCGVALDNRMMPATHKIDRYEVL
jgi:hypothetical protein